MSQPKRYSLVSSYYCSDAKMEAFEDGEFVRHADYAALQAEVERLTKAGDAMENALMCSGCSECEGMYDSHEKALEAWLAAKGVQS